jgi:hypothetical protein
MLLRYFRELGKGLVHSVQVDEQGRPSGRYGALCGATVLTAMTSEEVTITHEVLPHTLTGKARCRRCHYVEAAKGPVKGWERPRG